jgi:hypothetical protein
MTMKYAPESDSNGHTLQAIVVFDTPNHLLPKMQALEAVIGRRVRAVVTVHQATKTLDIYGDSRTDPDRTSDNANNATSLYKNFADSLDALGVIQTALSSEFADRIVLLDHSSLIVNLQATLVAIHQALGLATWNYDKCTDNH